MENVQVDFDVLRLLPKNYTELIVGKTDAKNVPFKRR